ncbi:MAG: ribosome biogenesis GTPase Der [Dehalococcoidia bacterium]
MDVPAKSAARPLVAIVGRPNVGKSALFNRMIGERKALVEEIAGTTRDRVYGDVAWRGESFRLVDTGGLEPDVDSGYPELIRQQIALALAEATILLFVVDAKDGITSTDLDVADMLRRAGKPVHLLANKAESESRREAAVQFYELGLGEPIPVSAHHGTGVAEVLDTVLEALPPSPEETEVVVPRLAIVGRPNVGKSMLLNAVLGEDRVIVSDVPGTTRDAVDTAFEFEGRPLVLVDTAGLRRRGKMTRGLEQHAALRARRALERADVALVVLDAVDKLIAQDLHVLGYALQAKTGVVVVANKWDLMGAASRAEFESDVRRRIHFARWVSFGIVSAQEATGIDPLLREALRVCDERHRRIETGPLNALIHRANADQPPPMVRNQQPKLFYVTQARAAPPTFVFFVNDASLVHFSYRRHLENVIRQQFGFDGVALKLAFRSRKER